MLSGGNQTDGNFLERFLTLTILQITFKHTVLITFCPKKKCLVFTMVRQDMFILLDPIA